MPSPEKRGVEGVGRADGRGRFFFGVARGCGECARGGASESASDGVMRAMRERGEGSVERDMHRIEDRTGNGKASSGQRARERGSGERGHDAAAYRTVPPTTAKREVDAEEEDVDGSVPSLVSERVENPEFHDSWWARLTFGWLQPLLELGARRPLRMRDLWQLSGVDDVCALSQRFERVWQRQRPGVVEAPGRLVRQRAARPIPIHERQREPHLITDTVEGADLEAAVICSDMPPELPLSRDRERHTARATALVLALLRLCGARFFASMPIKPHRCAAARHRLRVAVDDGAAVPVVLFAALLSPQLPRRQPCARRIGGGHLPQDAAVVDSVAEPAFRRTSGEPHRGGCAESVGGPDAVPTRHLSDWAGIAGRSAVHGGADSAQHGGGPSRTTAERRLDALQRRAGAPDERGAVGHPPDQSDGVGARLFATRGAGAAARTDGVATETPGGGGGQFLVGGSAGADRRGELRLHGPVGRRGAADGLAGVHRPGTLQYPPVSALSRIQAYLLHEQVPGRAQGRNEVGGDEESVGKEAEVRTRPLHREAAGTVSDEEQESLVNGAAVARTSDLSVAAAAAGNHAPYKERVPMQPALPLSADTVNAHHSTEAAHTEASDVVVHVEHLSFSYEPPWHLPSKAYRRSTTDETEHMLPETASAVDAVPMRPPIILHDICLRIHRGELVMVMGDVGSGKSSLLQALLGEMYAIPTGAAAASPPLPYLHGDSVAYAPQEPYIVNASVRDNIVFFSEYDAQRYAAALEATALVDDIALLDDGDATEIGSKGINLSGGQKARVALARAIYSRAPMLLLDDPLSAVDAGVGRVLFELALCGPLARHRTRILVTHHTQWLHRADRIVCMSQGHITGCGTYEEYLRWQMKPAAAPTTAVSDDRNGALVPVSLADDAHGSNQDAASATVSEAQPVSAAAKTYPERSAPLAAADGDTKLAPSPYPRRKRARLPHLLQGGRRTVLVGTAGGRRAVASVARIHRLVVERVVEQQRRVSIERWSGWTSLTDAVVSVWGVQQRGAAHRAVVADGAERRQQHHSASTAAPITRGRRQRCRSPSAFHHLLPPSVSVAGAVHLHAAAAAGGAGGTGRSGGRPPSALPPAAAGAARAQLVLRHHPHRPHPQPLQQRPGRGRSAPAVVDAVLSEHAVPSGRRHGGAVVRDSGGAGGAGAHVLPLFAHRPLLPAHIARIEASGGGHQVAAAGAHGRDRRRHSGGARVRVRRRAPRGQRAPHSGQHPPVSLRGGLQSVAVAAAGVVRRADRVRLRRGRGAGARLRQRGRRRPLHQLRPDDHAVAVVAGAHQRRCRKQHECGGAGALGGARRGNRMGAGHTTAAGIGGRAAAGVGVAVARRHRLRGRVVAISTGAAAGVARCVVSYRGRSAGGHRGAHRRRQIVGGASAVSHRGRPAGGWPHLHRRCGYRRRRSVAVAPATGHGGATQHHLLGHGARQPGSVRGAHGCGAAAGVATSAPVAVR
eukprot:ctg_740.g176